jgi:hypothetical protein
VILDAIKALKKGETISLGGGELLDPLHTVYLAVQHAASIFAERVSVLDEFEPLLNFGKDDWTAYLNKSLLDLKIPRGKRLAHFMKHGREPNQWNEFIFEAYQHHQFDAIFLAGLRDVPGSLPHGPWENAAD